MQVSGANPVAGSVLPPAAATLPLGQLDTRVASAAVTLQEPSTFELPAEVWKKIIALLPHQERGKLPLVSTQFLKWVWADYLQGVYLVGDMFRLPDSDALPQ